MSHIFSTFLTKVLKMLLLQASPALQTLIISKIPTDTGSLLSTVVAHGPPVQFGNEQIFQACF